MAGAGAPLQDLLAPGVQLGHGGSFVKNESGAICARDSSGAAYTYVRCKDPAAANDAVTYGFADGRYVQKGTLTTANALTVVQSSGKITETDVTLVSGVLTRAGTLRIQVTSTGFGEVSPSAAVHINSGNFPRISLGNQSNDGDVHFGSKGRAGATDQDYGAYMAYNAYRNSADDTWRHSRTSTVGAYMISCGHHKAFGFDYSASAGSGSITFTRLMSITNAGHVGIGCTPADTGAFGRALDVQSATGAAAYFRDSDDTTKYALYGFYGGLGYFGTWGTATVSAFYAAGSEAFRINASRQVLIGTATANTGLLQLASGTTAANGIGFGSEHQIYRESATILASTLDMSINGVRIGLGGGAVASNTCVGSGAMAATATGTYSAAFGFQALQACLGGGFNAALGAQAGYSLTTGTGTVFIGYQAGAFYIGGTNALTAPTNGIYIGRGCRANNATTSNEIVFGYAAEGKGSNTAVWGNTSITDHYFAGNVSVTNTSGVAKRREVFTTSNGENGIQIRLVNRTGATSVKGQIVSASTSYDGAFQTSAGDGYAPCFVVAESGIADGAECWVWIEGSYCQVLLKDGTASTRGYWVKQSDTAGRADATNAAPPGGTITALEDHSREIGHCFESKTAGTNVLALMYLHTN